MSDLIHTSFNITPELERYALEHSSAEPEVLRQLARETYQKALYTRMLSGPAQGALLAMLVRFYRPRCVLEVGTYTGYSAIAMALALPPASVLHTIDVNDELRWMCEKYMALAQVNNRVKLYSGDALKIIPMLKEDFDFVFLDADKEHYPDYYIMLRKRLKSGSVILCDNVLWSGKVLSAEGEKIDKETKGIREFNTMVINDEGVEVVMLPIRDGISVIYIK